MKLSVKTVSGKTIYAGTIVRLPWGEDERIVYAMFDGVCGSTKTRKIGAALTKASRLPKAIYISNVLDGDKVELGKSLMMYPRGVPFTVAGPEEQMAYRRKVVVAIKRAENERERKETNGGVPKAGCRKTAED